MPDMRFTLARCLKCITSRNIYNNYFPLYIDYVQHTWVVFCCIFCHFLMLYFSFICERTMCPPVELGDRRNSLRLTVMARYLVAIDVGSCTCLQAFVWDTSCPLPDSCLRESRFLDRNSIKIHLQRYVLWGTLQAFICRCHLPYNLSLSVRAGRWLGTLSGQVLGDTSPGTSYATNLSSQCIRPCWRRHWLFMNAHVLKILILIMKFLC